MAKILIVDDSESFRNQMNLILKDEHQVVEAVDGIDALNVLNNKNDFDLIICDINMPNMDGIVFCKKKFANKLLEKIPVIMVTTESNIDIKNDLKNYGVKVWVLKPFESISFKKGLELLLNKLVTDEQKSR